MDKQVPRVADAVRDVMDGATILIGGQTNAGIANHLLSALAETGVKELTLVTNHSGIGQDGITRLFELGAVRKIICSWPRTGKAFQQAYFAGQVELELVPQGTLSERIRAGGAGIGAFYTPTGVGTKMAEGKEVRCFNGREYVLEHAIQADFALIKAHQADPWGNLVYSKAARNWNPTMAPAARVTIAEVREIVPLGDLHPECIITPGVYVNRVVQIGDGGFEK